MSSSTEDPNSQVDLGNTFGALFIGAILAAVLFGLSNVQAFLYFQTHGGTGITFHKLVVIWLWIFDALHLALIIHSVYYYLVINYANIGALTEIVWSFKFQIAIDVVLIYGVHIMYVHRIWIVSKGRSRTLPTIVCILVVLVSGPAIGEGLMILLFSVHLFYLTIAAAWAVYQCHVFTDLVGIEWATFMAFGTTVSVDFLIASSLCYLLAASRTGFSNTDSFITKLMAYTINTGCLTSLFSLTTMITCAVMPHNFVFLGLEFLVTKLYVNSFFALLNAPYYLQAGANTTNSSEFHMRPRPELHIKTSQDGELQASRKNMFRFFGDEVVHSTLSDKQPIEVAVEMDSFSSA